MSWGRGYVQRMVRRDNCIACKGPMDRALISARKCTACVEASEKRYRESQKHSIRSPVLYRRIWDRDGGKCQKCGLVVRRGKSDRYDSRSDLGEVDHIVPKSRGGLATEDNLQLLCLACNRAKGCRTE